MQQKLNEKKLPYTVIVTLPTLEDRRLLNSTNPEFIIPSKDYTEQWKITGADYLSFIKAVQDSVLRENLYFLIPRTSNEEANKLLSYSHLYFDDNSFEYVEWDPSDRDLSRDLFPLNYSCKFQSLSNASQLLIDSIKKMVSYTTPVFRYQYIDSKKKSEMGELIIQPVTWLNTFGENVLHKDHLALLIEDEDHRFNPKGKELDMSFYNVFDQTTSVRCHENLSRFIMYNAVAILPGSEQIDPNALIQTISYEQALAFYYWKFPIHNPDQKDNWQKFVLPSKEQFDAVQQGKQIIIPEKKVEYPTPLFRYVVHVYQK